MAAFVAGVTPTALRAASSPALCGSVARPASVAPSAAAGRVRMAFSSLDRPETAVKAVVEDLEAMDLTVRAVYKQVFGNAYLMEEELAGLAVAESQFREVHGSVREFIRDLAKSEQYKKRFFETAGPYRCVELNTKHLLGRGPTGQAEVSQHVQTLASAGWDADIDSYLDSDEYEARFGDDTVPRFIFQGAYPRNDDFNRMCVMRAHWDGCSTSTRTGSTAPRKAQKAKLTMGAGEHVFGFTSVLAGLPARAKADDPSAGPKPTGLPLNANAPIRMRIKVADNCYQVFEVPAMTPKDVPEWKKDMMAADAANATRRLNGVFF
ncbi:hypothetical protein I4F81_006313 [Pyropia yezoensis]|uniref:Uncharacterized protein n=1 Tax=Pyropia yezoensis TaxID=2788 RepID=A0ACC3C0T7_PYRYE|nr:hypothetical protein I4F81_006313 [Neopyropia yezoensis]|eukprot:contig_17540_g4291